VAGFTIYVPVVDDDSVDLGLAASGELGTIRSPKLDLQLKCTSHDAAGETLPFPLSTKNYNELRAENVLVPRILVVVVVPQDLTDWLVHSEDNLLVRHCGYWVSLRGMPESENVTSVTVHVPRSNQFTVEAVTQMMNSVANGGLP
jgi:hypothetical protein